MQVPVSRLSQPAYGPVVLIDKPSYGLCYCAVFTAQHCTAVDCPPLGRSRYSKRLLDLDAAPIVLSLSNITHYGVVTSHTCRSGFEPSAVVSTALLPAAVSRV